MNRKNAAANKKEGRDGALKSRHEPGARMSVLLSNPDYLLEGFTEKRCQYLGKIEDIPTSTNMSDRGYLLASLDDKRNLGRIPWRLGPEHNVTVTLSAYNMKIIKEDRTGSILHRIPIHEIASISYVNDDDEHLLFLKAGNACQQYCPCYVLVCPKRADAEEVCTILQQAFQLVYTEATMEHLNESISAGERGSRGSRSSMLLSSPLQVSPSHRATTPNVSPTRVAAVPEDSEEEDLDETELAASPHSLNSSGEGPTAEELVHRYMERLHKLLDFNELREFAALLKRYRDDLPVGEFLAKLSFLYGEQRQFLIPDMLSFIPEEDREDFDQFLHDNHLPSSSGGGKAHVVHVPSSSPPGIPHPPPPPPVIDPSAPPPPPTSPPPGPPKEGGVAVKRKRNKSSRHHHDSHVADVDKFIQDIDSQMDSILHTTNF